MKIVKSTKIDPVRQRAVSCGTTYIEVAFRAYTIYKDTPDSLKNGKHVGMYSFISLISYQSTRSDLVPYLHMAIRQIEGELSGVHSKASHAPATARGSLPGR